MSENYDALFNPNVKVKDSGSKNADEYSPSADKGQGGVYKAIIRFVPWWKNPTHGSIQEKWVAWLEDPLTQRGRPVDCPSSVGKPSILQDMYWKLKKSDNVNMQKKSEIFSRRHTFASLIQVIKDQQNPELEGKILVYRYGVKIWEKINAELKPLIGEKHDPFDILSGKAFALVITKVSGYNNYDQAKFLNDSIPLCIPDENNKLIPIDENTDKKKVFNWVKENSPDLERYSFKEWDNDTTEYVHHVIRTVTGQASVPSNYADVKNKKEEGNKGVEDFEKSEKISSQELSIDDLDSSDDEIEIPNLDDDDDKDKGDEQGIKGDFDDLLNKL